MKSIKKLKSLTQSGFSHIELIIAVVVVIVIGGVGYYVLQHNSVSHASSSYLFSNPDAMVIAGPNLWVANSNNNTITEINRSNDDIVQILTGHNIDHPTALAYADGYIFIANGYNSVITKINASSGLFVMDTNGSKIGGVLNSLTVAGGHIWTGSCGALYELDENSGTLIHTYNKIGAYGLAADGNYVWATTPGGICGGINNGGVVEINATTGAIIQTLASSIYDFDNPWGITTSKGSVWVGNVNSVTEFTTPSGGLTQTLTSPKYGFSLSLYVYADGTHVWVINNNDTPSSRDTDTVTEINQSNGALVRIINNSAYYLRDSDAITSDGTDVWVANTKGNTVTKFSASTGDLVKVLTNTDAP